MENVLVTDRIESTSNSRIKELVRLRQRRHRDRTGRFLIEGFREISRAVQAGIVIDQIYACPELYLGSNEGTLVASAASQGAAEFEVAEAPFRKASYRDRPEGLLAVSAQFETGLDRIDLTGNPLVLVAEAIEKPGNLGTMLRTADAAGAAMIVCDPTTDPFNPNVVRASIGTLFTVPMAIAAAEEVIAHLRAGGLTIVATTPDTSRSIYEVDMTGPTAIVVGSEQYGLSDRWLGAADHRARLPMAGAADSLNAAMAAGISLFEAIRQRIG